MTSAADATQVEITTIRSMIMLLEPIEEFLNRRVIPKNEFKPLLSINFSRLYAGKNCKSEACHAGILAACGCRLCQKICLPEAGDLEKFDAQNKIAAAEALRPGHEHFEDRAMENGNHFDRLDDILIPALAFDRPMDVVEDPDLTVHEKKSILAAWASDAQAIADRPALRRGKTGAPVSVDQILDALRALDRQSDPAMPAAKEIRRQSIELFRAKHSNETNGET